MRNEEIMRILEKHEETHKEHNTRLTNLEKWRWLLTGGFLVLSIQNLPAIKNLITTGLAHLPIMIASAAK